MGGCSKDTCPGCRVRHIEEMNLGAVLYALDTYAVSVADPPATDRRGDPVNHGQNAGGRGDGGAGGGGGEGGSGGSHGVAGCAGGAGGAGGMAPNTDVSVSCYELGSTDTDDQHGGNAAPAPRLLFWKHPDPDVALMTVLFTNRRLISKDLAAQLLRGITDGMAARPTSDSILIPKLSKTSPAPPIDET